MHIQVVTFGLHGVTDAQYEQGCQGETSTFAELPGLLAKIWLRNVESNLYGAVYLWRDRESYDSYVKGDVFKSVRSDTTLKSVTSQEFEVFESLTKATQPGMKVL